MLRRLLFDPGVTFGHRCGELRQCVGVFTRDAVECLLKVSAGLLEVVLSLLLFGDEPQAFGLRRLEGSLEAFALLLVLDLALPRLVANRGERCIKFATSRLEIPDFVQQLRQPVFVILPLLCDLVLEACYFCTGARCQGGGFVAEPLLGVRSGRAHLSDRTLHSFTIRDFLCEPRLDVCLMPCRSSPFLGCALVGLLHRRRSVGQLTLEAAPGRGGLRKLRGEFGFELRQSLDLGRGRYVVVPRFGQRGLRGIHLSFEVIARRDGLRQFDLELCLAFSQRGRRGRPGRRVLPFRLTPRRLDLRQLLLDVGPRRAFLPDQPLELCLALGGRQPVSSGALVGLRQRRPRVDQLPFEAAPGRGGLRKLRGEFGFELRQSLDLGRGRYVVVPRFG
ncbi:MAG: hypothetical protein ACRD3C_09950, partial [Vicinamibacterales bacterium]